MTYQQRSKRTTWSTEQIRQARRTPLEPVLKKVGYRLQERENGNYLVLDLADTVIVKQHYWTCKDRDLAACTEQCQSGNSIDFFVKFRGMSFSEAMELLTS